MDNLNSNNEATFSKFGLQTATATDHMGLGATVANGAVAAITDFGTSIWNSLPFTEEVATSDLLSKINNDALTVYQEHPDAIHAASFIGGSLVPMGIAMKGMNLLRSGAKGATWFSTVGETSRLAAAETAFRDAGAASNIYKQSQNAIYAATAANAMVDSVVAEAAIVSTMNAHPYMEDYNKDFGSNFAFWSLVGGGIGAGVGMIGARTAIKNMAHGIESETITKILDRGGIPEASPTLSFSEQIQIRNNYANYLEGKLSNPIEPLDNFTENAIKFSVARERAVLKDIATNSMLSGELSKADTVIVKNITDKITIDPRFTGVDKISWLKPADYVPTKGIISETANFIKKTLKIDTETGLKEEVISNEKAVFLPSANNGKGAFVGIKESGNYSSIADLGLTAEQVAERGKRINLNYANHDQFLELQAVNTHEADLLFAAAVARTSEMDAKELSKINVSYNDLPMLQAIASRIKQLDPEEANKVSVTIASSVKGGDKTLDAVKLLDEVQSQTVDSINSFLKQGMAAETVALRTGADLADVVKIQQGSNQAYAALKYSDFSSIEKAVDPSNRALVLSKNVKKEVNDALLKANLNGRTSDNAGAELLNYFMGSSKSALVQDIYKSLGTESFKTLAKFLLDGIGEVTAAGLGNTFLRSADSAIERFGAAGKIATKLGQDNITIRNKISDRFVQPMAEGAGRILKDQAMTVEHNAALNFNASLSDWRIFDEKTGTFLQKKMVEGKEVLVPAEKDGKVFTIISQEVKDQFKLYQEAGKEMYELKNLKPRILGEPDISNIGFWVPAFNPRDKQIAYVFNKNTHETTLLFARTPGELIDGVTAYERDLKAKGLENSFDVVTKGKDQEYFNKLAGRHDPSYMATADITLRHGGSSAAALVKTNSEPMSELIQGFDHYLGKGIDDVIELNMQPVMDSLKLISDISQRGYEKGTLGTIGQMLKKPVDPGQVMRNVILGKPNLSLNEPWQKFQQTVQVGTERALNVLTSIVAPITDPVAGKIFGKEKIRNEETFIKLNKELEERGFTPLKAVDDYNRYIREGKVHPESLSPRLVALSNSVAATMLLKFMEIAQPFINAVSLPILTSGAIRRNLDKSFMGGVLDENAKFSVTSAMFDGIRLMNHSEGARLGAIAEKEGIFENRISEANALMQHIHSVEGGVISSVEKALESNFMKMMAKPSNASEEMVRKAAFFTGAGIARKAYPGLSDVGVVTYARSFMNEAIGNYTAAQRPVAFQGTLGVAMGLFQTYMLTFAQNTYRQIGQKDWQGLSRTLLAQTGIFGASSLPGFHVVSEAIGTHFSDNHIDLETGTFRAIGDTNANIALYGLLSSFGPGITTRGDIQPRIPTPLTLDTIATINLAKQSYKAGEKLVQAAFQADQSTGRAMLEALSLQSVSRPVARLSELVSGTSLTGAGNVVANSQEIYTTQGIFSRLLSTRPLEEIKAREAIHLDSFYKGIDSDRRKALTERLKTHIRSGDLTSDSVQNLQHEYMRVGTANGWRSAVNTALIESTTSGDRSVKNRLKPDAPYQQMIDDIGL